MIDKPGRPNERRTSIQRHEAGRAAKTGLESSTDVQPGDNQRAAARPGATGAYLYGA